MMIYMQKVINITITDEELEWQTEVFKLTNSKVPEEDAFNFICKFKSLYYAATQNGFRLRMKNWIEQ